MYDVFYDSDNPVGGGHSGHPFGHPKASTGGVAIAPSAHVGVQKHGGFGSHFGGTAGTGRFASSVGMADTL